MTQKTRGVKVHLGRKLSRLKPTSSTGVMNNAFFIVGLILALFIDINVKKANS